MLLICLVCIECARSFLAVQAAGIAFVSFVSRGEGTRLERRGGGRLCRLSSLGEVRNVSNISIKC
jgi:hypothetical protein